MNNTDSDIAVTLQCASRIAFYVDQENGAPEFWNAVETITPPNEDAALLRDLTMSGPLVVSSVQARRILAWAQSLPEWDDDEAPEFAPHPLLVQDADND